MNENRNLPLLMPEPEVTNLLSFNQIGAILSFHKSFIITLAVVITALTAFVTLMLPKHYEATAGVVLDYKNNDPISGKYFSAGLSISYRQTQLDIMNSQQVSIEAVKRLRRLGHDFSEFQKYDEPVALDRVAGYLKSGLDVASASDSHIFDFTFGSDDPQFAADAANAYAESYMKIKSELDLKPARQREAQYSKTLEELRQRVDAEQKKISGYLRGVGIIDVEERFDMESKRLSELNYVLVGIQASKEEAIAKRDVIQANEKNGGGSTKEVLQDGYLQSLKHEKNKLETEIQEMSDVYGPNHPKLKAAKDSLYSVNRKLASESNSMVDGILNELEVTQRQERAVKRSLEEQKQVVLELKKHREVLSSLVREKEAAERVYLSALDSYKELLMASRVEQPDVLLTSRAVPPSNHVFPIFGLNVMLGFIVGLLLGITISLVRELSSRRVFCEEDLETGLDVPYLGVINNASPTMA